MLRRYHAPRLSLLIPATCPLPVLRPSPPRTAAAGYVTVDEKRGRRLFYYFVESGR